MHLAPLLPLLLPLPLGVQLPVEGLAPGERARLLPPPAAPELEGALRAGRVIDAFSGRPVAGASVETWTEEITGVGRGLRRVGEARSGRGGQFRVRVRDGGLAAEKVRVRAPGYLTFPGVVPDLEQVLLFPAQERTPRLRVVDLAGEPIAGARVTTTYSCAHDVPAFDVRADAFGVVELPEYGLQDQIGDLRVRADGFGGWKYVDWSDVLGPPAEGPAVLALPRRPVLRVRFLGPRGAPLANRVLYVVDGDGHHAPFTDAAGEVTLAERYDGDELSVYALAEETREFLFAGPVPEGRVVPLRTVRRPPPELPTGRLRFVAPGLRERAPLSLDLFHEDGWTDALRLPAEAEAELPAGRVTVLLGGRFDPWAPQVLELELQAGAERSVELDPVPAPLLEVRTPPGEAEAILVEADGDSAQVDPGRDGVTRLPVPAGRPLTVVARGDRMRRAVLDGIEQDAAVDLTGDETLAPELGGRPDLAERPRAALAVRVLAPDGTPLPCTLDVTVRGEEAVAETGAGAFRVEAAAGEPILVRASAAGYADTGARARLGQQDPLVLAPLPLAAVAVEAPQPFTVAPPFEDGLDALHPGPVELVLVLDDGRRLALALELAPGARRQLTIRE